MVVEYLAKIDHNPKSFGRNMRKKKLLFEFG